MSEDYDVEVEPVMDNSTKKKSQKKRNTVNATTMYRAICAMAHVVHPENSHFSLQVLPQLDGQLNVCLFRSHLYDAHNPETDFDLLLLVAQAGGATIEDALSCLLELMKEKVEMLKQQRLKEIDDVLSAHTGVVRAARQKRNR